MQELLFEPPPHLSHINNALAGKRIAYPQLMRELIDFGLDHITHPGCGPFVAAIQEVEGDKVVVIGANLVLYWKQSWAHGERVALALAQRLLDTHVLPQKKYRMLSTAQLCIACYGEALSSQLAEIVTAATAADVEELTPFREGVLPEQWISHLEKQGISYVPEVERPYARTLLAKYGKDGPDYFNAGS